MKNEFLEKLRNALFGLPNDDIEERIAFYNEMIDDKIEEGLSESQAVSEMGSIERIVEQTITEISFTKIAKERIMPKRRLKVWEIILLVLGSPIWLSLGIALFAVILSLYIVLWSVIISLWAVFASLISCSIGGIFAGIVFISNNNILPGIAMLSAGIAIAGLAIFMYYGCNGATKGILILTAKIALSIKNCFIKKEELQ